MEELQSNKNDKRRGWITSFAVHAGLLFLAILPFMKFQVPPPGQQGVLVSFGAPDIGQGDDRPQTQMEEEVVPEPPSEAEEEEIEDEEVVAEEETVPPEASEAEASLPEEVVTSDIPDETAIAKKKEEERKKQEELDRQKKLEEDRKKAEEEAKKKAEEEAKQKAEYEKAKKQFGDVFGEGKGKTDKPGNQGDPEGDPDATRLEGISTGSGMVGGGLGDRGVVYTPEIKDNSQKTGRVVVRVCVNQKGEVSSATFTQKGSTTADSELRNIAIRSAKRFRFTKSSIDKQCGTITIDFKVR